MFVTALCIIMEGQEIKYNQKFKDSYLLMLIFADGIPIYRTGTDTQEMCKDVQEILVLRSILPRHK